MKNLEDQSLYKHNSM